MSPFLISGNSSNSDPLSLHIYLYANADSINGFDPSGHSVVPNSDMGDLAHVIFFLWVNFKGGIGEAPLSDTFPNIKPEFASSRPDGLFTDSALKGFYELKPISHSNPGSPWHPFDVDQLQDYQDALRPYGIGAGDNELFLGASPMTPVAAGDFTYESIDYRVTFYGADATAFGNSNGTGLIYYSLDIDPNIPQSFVSVPSSQIPQNLRYPKNEQFYIPFIVPGETSSAWSTEEKVDATFGCVLGGFWLGLGVYLGISTLLTTMAGAPV